MTGQTTPLLDRLFRDFNDTGVEWALLRGRATLGLPGRDVDLLVRREHLGAFEDILFDRRAVMLPVSTHPWHRFYLVPDQGSGTTVKLDVVTEVIYNRKRRIASHLEDGCLARRGRDGDLYVLDPTDMFWTVLLHCVLDKQQVTQRRAAELVTAADDLYRPSPGEEFLEGLCPQGWSADRAIGCVRDRQWTSLAALGREILPEPERPTAETPARASSRTRRVIKAAERAAYPVLWRRAGLGTVPRVVDLIEAASVEGTILTVRRRPGVCEVELLVPAEQRARLQSELRRDHYLSVGGSWSRVPTVGLERVDLLCAPERAEAVRRSSLPVAGRTHCRRAVPQR